ncbi:MAG: hypothetical protein K2L42_03265 [Clostridia bacterium]|nr:hypothetical protein [Clostridia bacterium]
MDDREYHIYVHLEGGGSKKKSVAGDGGGSTGTDNVDESSGSSVQDAVANKLKKMVSFPAIKSTADKLVNARIAQVSLQTGATEYEERVSYVYNNISQTVGAGYALLSGFAVGGPAGLAVAGIALAATAVNKVVEIAQKQRMLQLQQSMENISIDMARVRAGVSGRRAKDQ